LTRILIVDDQPGVRHFIREELDKAGFETSSVGEIESMWRHLELFPTDIVLLEVIIGKTRAWNIISDLKEKFPELTVLIVTAYDSYAHDPRLSDADGYWIKSFTRFDGLKKKINDTLLYKPRKRIVPGRTEKELYC